MSADQTQMSCMCCSVQDFRVSRVTESFPLIPFRYKAVAEGSVSFFIDDFVTARVTKLTYGTIKEARYNAADPEHVARKDTTRYDASGILVVPEYFDVILKKVSLILSDWWFLYPE